MLSLPLKLTQFRAWAAASACALVLVCTSAHAQEDPPDQAGRISTLSGTVSIQPAGSDDWGQAYPNLPVGPGDRIFTDQDAEVEVQVGQSYLRIGRNTDITLVNDSAQEITFGVAQGAVHVRSFGLWPEQGIDISTPNGDVRLAQAGELRVDVMPDQGATVFTSYGSGADVSGADGFEQPMAGWEALEVAGSNPVYPQWLQPETPDFLDQWSQQRDRQILDAMSYRYVNPEMPGAADLDAYGQWDPDSDYGPIWYPRGVPADWQPYHNGHWINREPWGWVWVEDEPWGYAPFHYGRWVVFGGRWGWVPGPRQVHPVWSPALVVFVGGGVGVSAWFPLGPGEAYRPWYHCSPHYVDRVNITNIHESRIVHVQNTYVNVVNVTNVTNITYVNRTAGVTAMRQDDFASGRSARVAAVNIDRRQFEHAQAVQQPAPVTRQSFVTRPVAHPVHVTEMRPTFINHQGLQISASPSAPPQQPPVRQPQTFRPLPGRTVVQPPPTSRFQGQQQPAPGQGGRPLPPYQNQGRPDQGRQQNYTNQPANNGYPEPNPPVAPGLRPTGRPIPSPRGGQEGNPNQPQYNPPPSNPQHQQPNPGQQERRDFHQPPPSQPQYNPPPSNNDRPDYGRDQQNRRGGDEQDRHQPPPNNPPQERPAPPQHFEQRPAPQREPERPAPPPANMHSQPQPTQQSRPNNDNHQNDKNDNNNQKKDDKKGHN